MRCRRARRARGGAVTARSDGARSSAAATPASRRDCQSRYRSPERCPGETGLALPAKPIRPVLPAWRQRTWWLALLFGVVLQAHAWTFISSPDWFNRDVADLSGDTTGIPEAEGWDDNVSGGLNGISPQMMSVYDFIIGEMTAYSPGFYVVAGDLVDGRWFNDLTLDMFDPDTRDRGEAIDNAGDIYYSWYRQLFGRHGIETVVAAIGDHEIGNDDWPAGSEKALYLTAMKRAFARNILDPQAFPTQINGADARPFGTPYAGSSYAYQHDNLLVISVDVFRQDDPQSNVHTLLGTVSTEVSGAHLAWLADLLSAADQDASIDHVILQGHTPVLRPVRMQSSSGVMMVGRQDSGFWQLLRQHDHSHGGKVRLYLCGEMHAITASKDPESDIVQLVHGDPPWGAGTTHILVFDVLPDRIDIESREFTLLEDGSSLYWQPAAPVSSGPSAAMASTRSGTLTVDTSGAATTYAASGELRLVDQTGLTIHFGFDQTTPSGAFSNTGSIGDRHYEGVAHGGLATQDGMFGAALRLNGADAYMESGRGNITEGENRTASVWINTSAPTTGTVLGYGSDWGGHPWVNGRFHLQIDSGKPRLKIGASVSCAPESAPDVADGTWRHVAVVLPGTHKNRCSDVLFYVDGNEFPAGEGNASASIDTVAWSDIRIGAGKSGNSIADFFDGAIDDAAIWGSALFRAKVRALATAGLHVELRYDAAAMESLFDLFDARTGSVMIGDLTWSYVTGLQGAGGDVLDLSDRIAIQLDEKGNGVAAPLDPDRALIGDNGGPGTSYTGTWRVSGAAGSYGADSLYANEAGATYSYTFSLPASGEYRVYAWWTVVPNRRSSVPYDITHLGGTDTVIVDQQRDGGQWNQLGTTWHFGFTATITIRSLGDGTTCADAIMLVPVDPTTNQPPVLSPIGDRGVTAGNTLGFTVKASDNDQTAPLMSASGLPSGAEFNDHGDGTARFDWPTTSGDLGIHTMTFTATDTADSSLADTETITVSVYSAGMTEAAKLIPLDAAVDQRFGQSVAIAGETAVIARTGVSGIGAAYVFARESDGHWVQQSSLAPRDAAAGFGTSVGISGDTVVVGASVDDCRNDSAGQCGAAYVFTRDAAGAWIEQATLRARDGEDGDQFGGSVAIDGDTIVVGAVASGNPGKSGAAYAFERDDHGAWIETARLAASDGSPQDAFGAAVAISGQTTTIGDSVGGAAYIFVRDPGGAWTETARLTDPEARTETAFGGAIALSGEIVAIGATGDDTQGVNAGAVHVFERDDGTMWQPVAKLVAGDGSDGARFGSAVSLSDSHLAVGAYLANGKAPGAGAAYVFGRNKDDAWAQVTKLQASDGSPDDHLGYPLAVATDNYDVLVGAPSHNAVAWQSGAVYAFDIARSRVPLLLRRTDNGRWYAYDLTGTQVSREGFIGLRRSWDFEPVSRADFNGDGHPDVLLREAGSDPAGRWQLYMLEGPIVRDYGYVSLPAEAEWLMMDGRDYDGDGMADVLLRHAVTGEWRLYLLNGHEIVAEGVLPVSTSLSDTRIGSADFNGDGRQDVLLRNLDGSWRVYLLDGLERTPPGAPEAIVIEILNATCASPSTLVFHLNDTLLATSASDPSFSCSCDAPIDTVSITDRQLIDAAWLEGQGNVLRFLKTGGDADVAWVRARLEFPNGADTTCLFDEAGGGCEQPDLCTAGSTIDDVDSSVSIFKAPMDASLPFKLDLDWQVDALEDFNGDGADDVLIKRPGGRWYLYLMDGTEVLEQGSPILTKNPDLYFRAAADFSGDGRSDLLLQHADGHWDLHVLDGLTVLESGSPSLNKNTAFEIVDIGDCNMDGTADVIIKRPDGPWVVNLMDGPRVMEKGWPQMVQGAVWLPIVD